MKIKKVEKVDDKQIRITLDLSSLPDNSPKFADFWVDKLQKAINKGRYCELITTEMQIQKEDWKKINEIQDKYYKNKGDKNE